MKMKTKLSPLKSIRKYCVDNCMVSQEHEVRVCPTEACPLYGLRFGKNTNGLKVLKQIQERCLDCSGYSYAEVRKCEHSDCELYPFRMGKNPNRAGIGKTKEQMNSVREKRLETIEIS